MMQGFYIFGIFVFKRNVLITILGKKKYYEITTLGTKNNNPEDAVQLKSINSQSRRQTQAISLTNSIDNSTHFSEVPLDTKNWYFLNKKAYFCSKLNTVDSQKVLLYLLRCHKQKKKIEPIFYILPKNFLWERSHVFLPVLPCLTMYYVFML